jgi:hypothetical protein
MVPHLDALIAEEPGAQQQADANDGDKQPIFDRGRPPIVASQMSPQSPHGYTLVPIFTSSRLGANR